MARVARACQGGLVGAVCLFMGCKESTATAAPPVINAVGKWTGTTGQGRTMNFTVNSTGLAEIAVSWQLTGTSCSVNATVTRSINPPAAVASNAFTVTHDLGPQLGAVITMAGQFKSASSASGTLRIDDSVCKGTTNTNWNATK